MVGIPDKGWVPGRREAFYDWRVMRPKRRTPATKHFDDMAQHSC